MWSAGTEPIHVFLGQIRAAVQIAGEPAIWSGTESPAAGWGWVVEVLRTDARTRGRRVKPQVWLSGGLARPFILPVLPGALDLDEAEKIASHMAPEQTGLEGTCCVSLERWTRDGPCLSTAMSLELRNLLLAQEDKASPAASAVRPWWSAGLNAVVRGTDAPNLVGLRDEDSLTVLGGLGERFELAGSYAAMDAMASAQLLARLTVAHPELDRMAVLSTYYETGATTRSTSERVLELPFPVFREPAP